VTRCCLFASLAMASAVAHALGLGPISGDVPLGKPLRIEVPLLSTGGMVPSAECFSVVPLTDRIDDDYFPRDIRFHVDSMGRTSKLVVTTRSIIRQPVIEFRISAGCTYGIARDYLLMVAAPVAPPAPVATTAAEPPQASRNSGPKGSVPVPAPVPEVMSVQASTSSEKGLPDGIAGIELVLDGDTTLDQLARQHYPGPLRRERFVRWVREANPRLFGATGDASSQRLAAGTRLIIPATVPPRRPGDHAKASEKASSSQSPATEAHVLPPAKKSEALTTEIPRKPGAAKGANDRLILGGGGSAKPPNLKEAVAMIDRLTDLLEQQVAREAEMTQRLQKLESSMIEMSKYVVQIESLARQREAQWKEERRLEQEAAKARERQGLIYLLLAVVGGGGIVAALLSFYHRLTVARRTSAPDFGIQSTYPVLRDDPTPSPADATATPVMSAPQASVAEPSTQEKKGRAIRTAKKEPVNAPVAAKTVTAKKVTPARPGDSIAPDDYHDFSVDEASMDAFHQAMQGVEGLMSASTVPQRAAAAAAAVEAMEHGVDAFDRAMRSTGAVPLTSRKPDTTAASAHKPEAESVEFRYIETPAATSASARVVTSEAAPASARVVTSAATPASAKVVSAGDGNVPLKLAVTPLPHVHEVVTQGRDEAIELVDIMTSMGLGEEAAQALVEHIRAEPRKSLHHWLKLLDLYRSTGMRDQFEKYATEMRCNFNVQAADWAATDAQISSRQTLEDYPHVAAYLQEIWLGDNCRTYLSELLFDHREGTREGFPQKVAEEILLLLAIVSNRD